MCTYTFTTVVLNQHHGTNNTVKECHSSKHIIIVRVLRDIERIRDIQEENDQLVVQITCDQAENTSAINNKI